MRLRAVTVDGVARQRAGSATRRSSCRSAASCRPGRRPSGPRAATAPRCGRSLGGSNWLFTKANGIVDAYRWIPWVSRATPFTRPNHGDPFVTPVSPLVTRHGRDRPQARSSRRPATGCRVAPNGLTQTFEARNVRDVTITAAPDFRTRSTLVGDDHGPRTTTGPRRTPARDPRRRRGRLPRDAGAARAYPYPIFKVVQSAGGYGMESPGLIWIPYGVGSANLRYLVAHETAHQWFYGLVGNDQARQPFADEAVADFVARDVTGTRRGEPLLDRPAGSVDLQLHERAATTRSSTSRAATCSTRRAGGWARPRSGRRSRVRRGPPVRDRRATRDAARGARRRDVGRPLDAVRGRGSRRSTDGRPGDPPAIGGRPRAPAASGGTTAAGAGSRPPAGRRARPRPRARADPSGRP